MFIPVNRQDMQERGWDELDFIYILGDAYVTEVSAYLIDLDDLNRRLGFV